MLLAAALTLGNYYSSHLNDLIHFYNRVLMKWILCHIIHSRFSVSNHDRSFPCYQRLAHLGMTQMLSAQQIIYYYV